jgi:hypothetical protein
MRSTPVYEADGFFNHATGPWYRGKRPHRSTASNNKNTTTNNKNNNNIAGSSAAVGAGAGSSVVAAGAAAPSPAPVVPDPAAHARAAKVFSLMTAQDPDATWIYQVGIIAAVSAPSLTDATWICRVG